MPTILRIQNMPRLPGFLRPSIRASIALSLGAILVVTSLLVYKTYTAVRAANANQANLAAAADETVLMEDVRAEYLNEWLVLISSGKAGDSGAAGRFEAARQSVDRAFERLTANASRLQAGDGARVEQLAAEHRRLADSWQPFIGLLGAETTSDAQATAMGGLLASSDGFVATLAAEVDVERADLDEALNISQVSRSQWERSAMLVGMLWVSVLVGAAMASQRWILKPLADVGRATRLIAAGETSAEAPMGGPTEVARLALDVNLMAAALLHRSKELSDYLAKDLETRTAELEAANEALRSSEARLNTVIENAPVILFAVDRNGLVTLSKGSGLALVDREPGSFDGQSVFQGNSPLAANVRRALKGESFKTEVTLGRNVFETHYSPVKDENGRTDSVIGVAMDVTERREAEKALRRSEERYRELFENASDIIYTHTLQGIFTSINKAGSTLSGYEEDEILGMSFADILTPESRATSLEMLRRKVQGETPRTTYEVEIVARDGHTVPLEVSTRLVFEGGKPVAVQGVARNISERLNAEASLKRHADDLEALFEQLTATHLELAKSQSELEEKSRLLEGTLEQERALSKLDALTGALNHGAIVAVLRDLVEGEMAAPSAVVMLDIDGMKAANDLYGHPFGDRVLRAIRDAMSRQGAVVGRYGGDEFVAVLEGAGRASAEAYRREVLEAVRTAGLKDPDAGNDVQIVVSIGFAVFPEDGGRIDELISVADGAMYASKRQHPATAGETSRRLGGEEAVRLVGEIVPVLTAAREPREGLAFVCQRLAVDRGYDAVGLMINPSRLPGREIVVAYPPIPAEFQADWLSARQEYYRDGHPLPGLLEKARRPLIIERAQEDTRLAAFQREILKLAGLRSLMIAPLSWENALIGSMTVASRREAAFGPLDGQLLMGLASQVSSIVSMTTLVHDFRDRAARLSTSRRDGIKLLATLVEAQAGVLSHDMDRLFNVAAALAKRLGFGPEETEEVGLAAMMHDVGKYRVPATILGQPQDLTEDEYEVVKSHTIWGARLLDDVPMFELAGQVARWHHERWDGCGYPDGLSGDEIPIKVAIASVADALDAMIYDRIYRQGVSSKVALDEVIASSGTHFNPRVVTALIELLNEGELLLEGQAPGGRQAA